MTMSSTAGSRRRLAVSSARAGVARAIDLIGAVVALILIVGILLVVLGANRHNGLVQAVRDAADWLAGPFNGLFDLKHRKVELAVDWGVAALVWLLLARLIARVIRP
jgi:hypothetical protein